MGCDLVAYKEVDDVGCSMSYSTFNRLRERIIIEYLLMNNKEIPEENPIAAIVCIPSAEFHKKVSHILETIGTDESVAMSVLWEHSDCDGAFYDEDCKYISNVIKKILENIEKDDDDKEWLEALYSTFKYVGDNNGILQMW